MMENILKIRQNRENNSGTVTEQKRIIENEIQQLRGKINNHLDKLQGDTCLFASRPEMFAGLMHTVLY
jgi:hypothetical protein